MGRRSPHPPTGALSKQRFVERVPAVGARNACPNFVDQNSAAVAVGHDCYAIAFPAMRVEVATESPVAARVREIPALAVLLDGEPHSEGARTHGRYHLLHHFLR